MGTGRLGAMVVLAPLEDESATPRDDAVKSHLRCAIQVIPVFSTSG
jgi:hypothetical protein